MTVFPDCSSGVLFFGDKSLKSFRSKIPIESNSTRPGISKFPDAQLRI